MSADDRISQREGVMREFLAAASIVFLAVAPAFAQGYFPTPNQLSLGIGVVGEGPSAPAPTVAFSFAFAEGADRYWRSRFGFVWEAELGPTSHAVACQAAEPVSDSENCWDASVFIGTRFHVFRRSGRRVLPFVDGLLGTYWEGSGSEDPMYLPASLALQGGGGLDLRRKGSIHGLRMAVDYRRVFTIGANRHQVRFLTAYVLGPGEPATAPQPVPRRP